MRATPRYWTVVAAGFVLAAGAVLFDRPVLLAGAITLGAWLVANQYRFVITLARLDDALSVDQTVTPPTVATGRDATLTLSVTCDAPADATVAVTPGLPAPIATATERVPEVTLSGDETTGERILPVRSPVAGEFAFAPATVTVTAGSGLFRETLERGPTATLTVAARAPREIHVGRSGETVAGAFGEHDATRTGSGTEPAELRQYVTSDPVSRIDWNATARLPSTYVREFEAESERTTLLLVDHRSSMAAGAPGETQLDYGRAVALTVLDSAIDHGDPVGLYTVGDEGLTSARQPSADTKAYRQHRRRLLDLAPTENPAHTTSDGRTPASARRVADRLDAERPAFDRTLRPFFLAIDRYVERIATDPLFATVRSRLRDFRGHLWTVIVTDDRHRHELREAAKLARRDGDHVLVLMTPRCLFAAGGLADLEAAYEQYVDFEEFRRDLAALDRVEALEVAPGDRLSAVLGVDRTRRTGTARRT